MVIKRAETEYEITQVRELWAEYWTSIGLPLEFQGFGEQIKTLPGEFTLLIAQQDGEPAGTIALRPLGANACEVKRLYVVPRFRGQGLGPKLLAAVVKDARQSGYTEMYCDTLPTMQTAAKLYETFGFVRVGPYSDHPTPDALYFRLDLTHGAA